MTHPTDQVEQRAAEELAKQRHDYRQLFLGSELGRKVLRDLLEVGCGTREKLFVAGQPDATAHNTGRRYVADYLHERLYLSEEELLELAEMAPAVQLLPKTPEETEDGQET